MKGRKTKVVESVKKKSIGKPSSPQLHILRKLFPLKADAKAGTY